MNLQQRTELFKVNVLSIKGILEEAELLKVKKRRTTEWEAQKSSTTHYLATTDYQFRRVTLSTRLGLLYCTTITGIQKVGAKLCALSREDLENELFATPENLLEKKGMEFDSLDQAILAYNQIHDIALTQRQAFSRYLTSF